MTRINLVPPVELMDQHLFAEFREIKMVPGSLARSIAARGIQGVIDNIPARFTLNAGHVSFFYDKGAYLLERYGLLRIELERRCINFNQEAMFDPVGIMLNEPWCKYWVPDEDALNIIRTRIAEKIQLKPSWYRYEGKALA